MLKTFISWINEDNEEKIKYKEPNYEYEWEEAMRYPEFVEMGKEDWIKKAKEGYITTYTKIKNVLGNVDLDFSNLEKGKKERFEKAYASGIIELPVVVKFNDKDYDLVAGNTRIAGLIKNGINPKVWVIDISKNEK